MGEPGGTGRQPKTKGQATRWARRLPLVVLAALLLAWPLTFRYSSVGLDAETARGDVVESRHYRIRWPGDGSVWAGWIDESRPAGERAAGGPDLAALVLQPPRPMTPRSAWNEMGFWREDVVAARGDQPSEAAAGADPVALVGVPHWVFVLAAASGLLVAYRRGRDQGTRRWWRGRIRATPR